MSVSRDACAERRVGTAICDKWRLERLLGVGGMGAVYEARHRNRARAAIKILHEELVSEPRVVERFKREAYIVNGIDHPAVVRVIDDDETALGEPYLVMDLVEGRTSSQVIASTQLGQSELLDIAEQVLDALVVAHASGIVHRDLKPRNLLLDQRRRVRILDFGIARLMDDEAFRTVVTTHGMVWGSLEYQAPEQLTGNVETSARTDIYGLGATLFTLASQEHLHEGADIRKRVLHAAVAAPRSLGEVRPDFDRSVIELVDRATRSAIGERWPSAELMLHEVRRVRAKLPPPSWERLLGPVSSTRRAIATAQSTRPQFGLPTTRSAPRPPRPEDESVSAASGEVPICAPPILSMPEATPARRGLVAAQVFALALILAFSAHWSLGRSTVMPGSPNKTPLPQIASSVRAVAVVPATQPAARPQAAIAETPPPTPAPARKSGRPPTSNEFGPRPASSVAPLDAFDPY